MCKITTCINLGICHSYLINNTATQQREALHMYTLQYRFRQERNGRLTKWYTVSSHDTAREGRQALGQHITEFATFDARLITSDGKTLGAYKYTQLG